MIYELMRRDIAWKYISLMLPLIAILCACPSPIFKIGAIGVATCLIVTMPMARATRFYAILPIAGRDLFLARILSIMAAAWLPALAGAAAAALFSRPSSAVAGPFVAAALCTLAVGFGQSIRVRALAVAARMQMALWFATLYAGLYLLRHPANALIPASCAVAGIALLVRTWFALPKSFELAPAKPRAWDNTPHLPLPAGVFSPRLAWLPLLIRPVLTSAYPMAIFFLFVGARNGHWVANSFWILFVWAIPRQNTLWLRPLPIRPRALLIAMAAPILLTLTGGYFRGLHYGRPPKPVPTLPIQVLDLGALLAWALVVVLAIELVEWRRWSHIPAKVRRGVGGVLMLAAIVGSLYSPSDNLLHDAVLHLAAALPNNVGVAITLVAAALIALWWATEKAFAEAEYVDKPRAPRDDYFRQ